MRLSSTRRILAPARRAVMAVPSFLTQRCGLTLRGSMPSAVVQASSSVEGVTGLVSTPATVTRWVGHLSQCLFTAKSGEHQHRRGRARWYEPLMS
jgi:hypothetical protein